MRVPFKRPIAFLMLIVMMLSMLDAIAVPTVSAAAAPTLNGFPNPCGYNPQYDGKIPDGIKPCSKPKKAGDNGFKFNSKYYHKTWVLNGATPPKTEGERKIIVYGDYSNIPKSVQDYRKGWQPGDFNSIIDPPNGEGHFYVWHEKYDRYTYGEYRFLGFDETGSLYPNDYMIRDDSTKNPLGSKHWVFEPWKSLPTSYIYKPNGSGPIYNFTNVMDPKFDGVLDNIRRSLDFQISQGVKYSDRYNVLPSNDINRDPRNYMNIPQVATPREAGIGLMYHYSWETKSLWYQSFPLLQLEPDEKTPNPAKCAAIQVSSKPIPLGKERYQKVQVKVTGELQDQMMYDDLQLESLFYTRKDVDYWTLGLKDPATQKLTTISSKTGKDGVVVKDNTATGLFTLLVDTEKLDRSNLKKWVYESKDIAKADVYHANHTASKPSTATIDCDLVLNFEPSPHGPMNSEFGVIEEISFDRKSQLVKENLGYVDYSYGNDVDYYTFEITNVDDGTKIKTTYDPAIPEVKAPKAGYLDQQKVNQYLFNFILSKFTNETVSATTVRNFHIKQTIVDKDSTVNNTSSATKTVKVTQQPFYACGIDHELLPPPPQYVTPKADWPIDWYDVVPFPVTDGVPDLIPHKGCEDPADFSEFEKKVFIDGTEVNATEFYSGNYIFGEHKLGIREVKITLTAPDGSVSHKLQHVNVHESKPYVYLKLDGLYKENRTMKAYENSAASNDVWVEKNSPLEVTTFSFVNTSDPNLKSRDGFGEGNLKEKMFMYKATGNYQLSMAAKRVITYGGGKTITRYSDPYIVEYEIMPDHKPAIIAHAYGSQVSRLDKLQLNYQVDSTDGDFIATKSLKVYHDTKNDGNFDKLVYETDGELTELPILDKLGQYKITVNAKEGTNQDRLMEFITPNDDKTHTYEGFFFVDNYEPSSDLYLDIPNEKPNMDVYFMLDSQLDKSKSQYVKNSVVTLTNAFNTANIIANVGVWDMRTYESNQSASTSQYSGRSYPSSSTSYSSSGYSGTLYLSSTSNPKTRVDEGKFVSVRDSMTGSSTCPSSVTTYYDKNGNYDSSSSWNNCSSSMPYSSGNYSGTISRTGESPDGPSCGPTGGKNSSCTRNWTAYYSGTIYWVHDVWEANWKEYDDYTGHYSGTIYKYVRQSYDASFMKAVQSKYVVYISDNTVTQLSDLQHVMNKQDARLITVGQSAIQSQITPEKYIQNSGTIESVVDKVISYIAESNPAIPKVLKLVGEQIETRTAIFDAEGDDTPDSEDKLQIIQDPYYYDNSMGFESIGGKTLISTQSEANWKAYQSLVTLNKPGKYTFYRKTKDQPTTDPNFAEYNYSSNESAIEVMVHRKPIADVALDFDYIAASNLYRTTWIDTSYDLDHNITRAGTDRGIQARTNKFTNQGTGEVFTKIPNELAPGTYVLDYVAQDIEGVWSDPIKRTFILPNSVPVQMKSNLKTAYNGFSLNSVPASESLVANELWTRYPYSISLNFAMDSYISKNVPYYSGTKNGNDITWYDQQFAIPNTTPDGTYNFTITGNGSVAGSTVVHPYAVKVVTPINLAGQIDDAKSGATNVSNIVVGETYQLKAITTKYPNVTAVTLFKGTGYQRNVTLTSTTSSSTGYGKKDWTGSFKVGTIPNGKYTVEWRSTTPNGRVETVSKTIDVVNNRPPTADFDWSPKPVYEGDLVNFQSNVNDLDGNTLSLVFELTSPAGVKSSFPYTLNGGPSYPARGPSIKLATIGAWTMKLTVSDGVAAPVIVTKIVQVLPLHAAGFVKHTDLWDEHRRDYNIKASGNAESPRGYSVFWAGEKFMLEANTTLTGTATRADRVEVKMEMGDYKTSLVSSNPNQTSWKGELWDTAFSKLAKGKITFTFTAYYNNGTIKIVTVDITVDGETQDIVGVHRVD